jgi:NADP-dependent 3-hydroxy acid dehydrogenase YdfG
MLVHALRLELNGEPIRVTEIAPGMVFTPEFTLNRLGGDQVAAEQVYDGVDSRSWHPMSPTSSRTR